MRLYLSRRANGSYQVTALEPVRTAMRGWNQEDLYPRPGDPVIFQGLCPFSIQRLVGQELACLEVRRLRVSTELLPVK